MKVEKWYKCTYNEGENKGKIAPFVGLIHWKTGDKSWVCEIFQEVEEGKNKDYKMRFRAEYKGLYHAERGLRMFREGLSWALAKG